MTDDDISTVCSSLATTTEPFRVATYEHLGLFGHHLFGWTGDIDWTHYDFYPEEVSLQQYVISNNLYDGNLKMTFDINANPIPTVISDPFGNVAEKQFAYISVDDAWVSNTQYGQVSNATPSISITVPDPDVDEDFIMTDDLDYTYVFKPTFRYMPPEMTSWGQIDPMTDGASLQPTAKDGSNLYDPTIDRSATDCALYYDIKISPYVTQYTQQLSWWEYTLIRQDEYIWAPIIPFPIGIEQFIKDQYSTARSETRDVAIMVNNQYIQTKISIQFNLWSAYKITALVEDSETILGLPTEYYNYLAWNTAVNGFGGGVGGSENPNQWMEEWMVYLIYIIIAIVAVIAIYVYLKMRKGKGMSNITINTK